MNGRGLLLALTVINVSAFLGTLAVSAWPASTAETAGVLRGRGLEIVDDQGRVRASIKVMPADPSVKMPDGRVGYPETVLLRLINDEGRPSIKIDANADGSGLLVGAARGTGYAVMRAKGDGIVLEMNTDDGRKLEVKP
jgi:hypothetical protein